MTWIPGRSRRLYPITPLPLSLLLPLACLALVLAERKTALACSFPDDPSPVVLREDFERDAPGGWDFTDRAAWRIARAQPAGNRVLELFQASKYEPPVRSPLNIALAKNVDLTDFVLDVKVRSTTRDYGHRDLCIIFGHQDASHFYYVHLAKQADEHANSVFLVNGEPRVSIAESRTQGTAWTDGWHHVRVLRRVKDGLIQVFFDDMEHPVMTAHDSHFKHGRIGLGSFDDTGMFDDLTVRGTVHQQPGRAGD